MITRYSQQARFAIGCYRSYRGMGYSRHLARVLARMIVADARAGLPLERY